MRFQKTSAEYAKFGFFNTDGKKIATPIKSGAIYLKLGTKVTFVVINKRYKF